MACGMPLALPCLRSLGDQAHTSSHDLKFFAVILSHYLTFKLEFDMIKMKLGNFAVAPYPHQGIETVSVVWNV